MKKVIRFILIPFFVTLASSSFAQLGMEFGYIYSPSSGNLTLGNDKEFTGTARNNGFQAGLTYDFKLKGELGLQTGLLYSFVGGKTKEESRILGGYPRATQLTTSACQFLDLPIRVTYSLPVTNDFKFFFFGGPVYSYGLSWNSKSHTMYKPFSEYSVYKDLKDEVSSFELKVGAGLGVHYDSFRLKIGYDQGILNLYAGEKRKNDNGAVNKLRRNQFNLTFGYVF